MDMDLVFLGTGGSVPTARRSTACVLVARRRRPDAVRLRRGLPAPDAALDRSRPGGRDLHHPPARRPLPRHPRAAEDLRPQRPRAPAADPRPAGARRPVQGPAADLRPPGLSSRAGRAAPGEAVERSEYEIRPFAVEHRMEALRLRAGRGSAARAASTRRRPSGSASRRARTSSACRRGETVEVDGRPVEPAAVMGEARAGRKLVLTGDTAPCEMTRGRRARRAGARARRELRRRRARACRARPATRPRARPPSWLPARGWRCWPWSTSPRVTTCARSSPRLASCSRRRSRRATSTSSRSRFPSAVSRGWSRAARGRSAEPSPGGARLMLDERLARHLHVESLRHRDLHPEHEPHVLFQRLDDRRAARRRLRRRRHLRGAR